MKGGGGQQQSGSGSMDVLWISAFVVLQLCYIWYAHSDIVAKVAYYISLYKLKALGAMLNYIKSLGIINVDNMLQQVAIANTGIKGLLSTNISINDLHDYVAQVNALFAYIYSFFASLYIVFILFLSKNNSFKKVFNMKSLRAQEKKNWSYIGVVPKGLLKKGLDDGPWAMSQQPLQLVLNNDLVDQEPVYGQVNLTVRDKHVHELFVRQMGVLWTGKLDCMPNYTKALFAIFAAKGNGDDASARKMIDQIALSSASGGSLNFNGATMLLAKHIRAKGVGIAVSPHAYLLTVMASLLEYARTGGVVAMAELLWLKQVDRRLWYMLQSVGRQTPFVEVAAAYAHWITEKKIKRPLKVPMVNEAVKSVVTAVKDIKYNPDGY